MARVVSNANGMRTANNIVVCAAIFPPINRGLFDIILDDKLIGDEPSDYQPSYSAFKVGWGDGDSYTNGDYNAFIDGMINHYNGVEQSEYACGSNLDGVINFSQENMNAILESDIAYISGHGYFGGVIPISSNGRNSYADVKKVFVANNSVKNSQFTAAGYFPKFEMEGNTFSFKSDENNESCSNLQWLIFGACSQLNDGPYEGHPDEVVKYDGKYSYMLWLDTLINNPKMRGIIGYYESAPAANNSYTPDSDVISDFLTNTSNEDTIYNSWLKANSAKAKKEIIFGIEIDYTTSQRAGLLVKGDYANETLHDSLADNSEINYSKVYLYKFSSGLFGVSTDKEDVTSEYAWIEPLSIYAQNNEIQLPQEMLFSTVTRDIYDDYGNYIETETVEYLLEVESNSSGISTFSLRNSTESQTLRINARTHEINVL